MKYCVAIVLLLASINTYADAKKWVDAEGHVHYSDSPPPQVKSQTLRMSPGQGTAASSSAPAAASAPAAPKTIFEKEADLKKEKKTKEEAAKKAAQEKELADTKRQNCEAARSQLATLQNAPRVTTYNEQGEPVLLDDAGRQARISQAQESVSKNCQ